MDLHDFAKTTIGEDCLRKGQDYPIDALLDYLSGLKRHRNDREDDPIWTLKYDNEIEAVKEVLKKQTA